MKILVVSGFLGAGKTTFIETMTSKVKKRFAVLENEYGEVGIDGELLKKDDINVWEMTEGCICCSMKANFAESVMTIANTVDPDILVVEPTGVGLLSSVLRNIKKVEYERIRILEPITVVDPMVIDHYLCEFGDIFEDQIKTSKKIIISKTEKLSEHEIRQAEAKIKKINPDCDIFSEEFRNMNVEWFENILDSYLDNSRNIDTGIEASSSSIENIGFRNVEFDSLETFESYMGAVMRGSFGKIIRAKGFLPVNGVWAKFDIVDKVYTMEQIEPMPESKIILIGTDLNKKDLQLLFKPKRFKKQLSKA